jgi:hypothetical protein
MHKNGVGYAFACGGNGDAELETKICNQVANTMRLK